MAANTPRLSLEELCNQLIQRQFDEVSNERDTAISRLDKTITINKKLKDDNAGCWHIIAKKQNEINALHDKNWQLQRDLDRERRERQKIKDLIGILSEEANRQDTTLCLPHEVRTSVGTSSNAVSFSSAPNGESHRTTITGLTSEATGLTRECDACVAQVQAVEGYLEAVRQNADAQVRTYGAPLMRDHESAMEQATKRADELNGDTNNPDGNIERLIQHHDAAIRTSDDKRKGLENEITRLKQDHDSAAKAHESVMRQARKTQEHLNSRIINLNGQLCTVIDQRNHATRQLKDLAVRMSAREYHMDVVVGDYEDKLWYADYEKSNAKAETQAEIAQLYLDLMVKDKELDDAEERRITTKQKLGCLEYQIEYYLGDGRGAKAKRARHD
ncbi:hypothetical protein KCU83_g5550, partial [Aureobasidium melanogenum]